MITDNHVSYDLFGQCYYVTNNGWQGNTCELRQQRPILVGALEYYIQFFFLGRGGFRGVDQSTYYISANMNQVIPTNLAGYAEAPEILRDNR